ncbi:MAG: hypothetical protein MUO82_11555 [Candidatus Thermoplasmatota archaeon]|nr:hypothetical protein [Candidatus Thermoplasmatota archaeon]
MYESLWWVVSMYDSRWVDVPGLKHGLKQPADESFELFKSKKYRIKTTNC